MNTPKMRLACNRCRRQKLKCVQADRSRRQCQRCQRANIQCSYSPTLPLGRPYGTNQDARYAGVPSPPGLPSPTHTHRGEQTLDPGNSLATQDICDLVGVDSGKGFVQETDYMDEYNRPIHYHDGPDAENLDVLTVADALPSDILPNPSPLANILFDNGILESLLTGQLMCSPPSTTGSGCGEDIFQQLLNLNLRIHKLVNSLKACSWPGRPSSSWTQPGLPEQVFPTACYPVQDIVGYSRIFLKILKECGLLSRYLSSSLGWDSEENQNTVPSPTFTSGSPSQCSNSSSSETLNQDPPIVFLILTCFTNIIQLHNIIFRDIIDGLQEDMNKRSAFQSALQDLQLGGVNLSSSEVLSMTVLVQTLVHMLKQMHTTMLRWKDDVWKTSDSSHMLKGDVFSSSAPGLIQDLIDPTSDWSSQSLWGKVRQAKHLLDAI